MNRRGVTRRTVLFALPALAACARFRSAPRATVPADDARRRLADLWVDRGDVARLDLFQGAGGPSGVLGPSTFTFVEKDEKGFSPGWDVRDASGVRWSVKQGPEAQSEVVASRLLWALGFHQPPTYYAAEWRLTGGPEPGAQPPGRFRPDMAGARRLPGWVWDRNEFAGTQAFRGLLVLMRVINNWDLLDRNNAVFTFETPRDGSARWHVVLDLGASFGRAYGMESRHSGSRNDLEDFERQGFLEGVDRDGYVEFDQLGKWHRGLFGRLRPADLAWTCGRLGALSGEQWKGAFRAGGFPDATAARFITALRRRIDAGLSLAASPRL
jgi:hypothetical protein